MRPPTTSRRWYVVDPVQLDVDGLLGGAGGDAHPEAAGPGVDRRDLVRRAAQLELDRPADLVLDLRPAAVGGLEQPGRLDAAASSTYASMRGGDHGDAGVRVGDEPALGADPVDPAGVGPAAGAVDDLGLGEQVEHEALVAGAALDHHGGLGHGPAQPGQRLVAGAAVGDDLGDHRVEVGRDGVALGDAGVDADARARRAGRGARCGPGTGRSRGRGPRR